MGIASIANTFVGKYAVDNGTTIAGTSVLGWINQFLWSNSGDIYIRVFHHVVRMQKNHAIYNIALYDLLGIDLHC